GFMRVDGNHGSAPNYSPNSFDNIERDPAYDKQYAEELVSNMAAVFDRNAPGEDDHYTQPGIFYREVLNDEEKTDLVDNIVGGMNGIDHVKRDDIIMRQLCHF